jgi:hypothetical protein
MSDPWAKSLLTGFVLVIVVVATVLMLLISLVGIPLAVVLRAMLGVALLLTGVSAADGIWRWFLETAYKQGAFPYLRLAIGAFAVVLLTSLPWLGEWILFLVLLLGVGGLALERHDRFLTLRSQGPM